MAGKYITKFRDIFLKFEDDIARTLLRRFQPGFCILGIELEDKKTKFSMKDLWSEGFYWAVPKHRRSLEKRLNRKFGWPEQYWKLLVPKTNLLSCRVCGHHHESDTLCGHCYSKVMNETREMQKAIERELKLDPIKEEIIVLYENEVELKPQRFWKGQRTVEMPRKRPSWFHCNLLEPSTQGLSDGKEVKTNN